MARGRGLASRCEGQRSFPQDAAFLQVVACAPVPLCSTSVPVPQCGESCALRRVLVVVGGLGCGQEEEESSAVPPPPGPQDRVPGEGCRARQPSWLLQSETRPLASGGRLCLGGVVCEKQWSPPLPCEGVFFDEKPI